MINDRLTTVNDSIDAINVTIVIVLNIINDHVDIGKQSLLISVNYDHVHIGKKSC